MKPPTVLIYAVQSSTSPTGLCRYTATLVKALKHNDRNVDLTLVLGRWQADYYRTLLGIDDSLAAIVALDIRNTVFGRYVVAPFRLRQLVAERDPALIHFTSPSVATLGSHGRPVVATVHDLYAYTHPATLKLPNRYLNRLTIALSLWRSDRLAVISETTRQSTVRLFPSSSRKVTVVYPDVAFSSASTETTPTPEIFLLSVAGHWPNKNLPLALEAIARTISAGALPGSLEYWVVGANGSHTDEVTQVAARMPFRTRFLRGLSDAALGNLYDRARMVVIASSVEGFCLPLVEAIQRGCVIVASDIDVLREVGGDRPVYFSLEDQPGENLAGALGKAFRSPRPAPDPAYFNKGDFGRNMHEIYCALISSDSARRVSGA